MRDRIRWTRSLLLPDLMFHWKLDLGAVYAWGTWYRVCDRVAT
jgi:hypothetical protein